MSLLLYELYVGALQILVNMIFKLSLNYEKIQIYGRACIRIFHDGNALNEFRLWFVNCDRWRLLVLLCYLMALHGSYVWALRDIISALP